MSYKEMLIKLKEEEKEIILIKNGVFYIAIGNDAVLLHKILGLKCTCFSKEICKVGIPITSLEKYTQMLKEKKYKYCVYELEENEEEIDIKIIQKDEDGVNENQEKLKSLECNECPRCKFAKDKYDKAFEKYKKQKGEK